MKLRSVLLTLGSIAVGMFLIASLISVAKIDPRATIRQLGGVNRMAFLRLILLLTLHIFLSAQKWQLMDCVIRRRRDTALSSSACFALTSAGVALGQVLPMQVSMMVARVLGTHFRGRAFARGTVGTLFDQGSDFLIVCFLIPASALAWIFAFGPITWVGLAIAMASLAFLTVDRSIAMVRRLAAHFAARNTTHPSRLQRGLGELAQSALLDPSLIRKLLALSALRFVVLVLMAGETSHATGSSVRLWHLAAAMPFVVLSSVLAITPGGIGLNELTYATALSVFGTPLAVGAQWALANRILVAAAAFTVAACTAGVLLLWKSHNILFRRNDALDAVS
jgi:uncharacterized membrane protein YbhN (UPF0104 family)